MKPSKEQAIAAVNTLLDYIGVDRSSQHIANTAQRVIASYQELYAGYDTRLDQIISDKFYDLPNSHNIVLLKKIEFNSICAHHMLPIVGHASIAYIPQNKIVGISKIAKVVNMFARRLQIQEHMSAEIAHALDSTLKPLGVAVKISAAHHCMVVRGVEQRHSLMDTYFFTGVFKDDKNYRAEFISSLQMTI